MNQLKQATQTDKTTGVKIAEAIQTRVDMRKAIEKPEQVSSLTQSPVETPRQQAPIPPTSTPTKTSEDLRPAPPPSEQSR